MQLCETMHTLCGFLLSQRSDDTKALTTATKIITILLTNRYIYIYMY